MFILKQVVVEKNVKQTIMITEKAGEAEIYTKFHDLLIKTGSVAWSNLIFFIMRWSRKLHKCHNV